MVYPVFLMFVVELHFPLVVVDAGVRGGRHSFKSRSAFVGQAPGLCLNAAEALNARAR